MSINDGYKPIVQIPSALGTPVAMVLYEGRPLIVTDSGYMLKLWPDGSLEYITMQIPRTEQPGA